MEVLLLKTRLSIIACRHIVPYYYKGVAIQIPEIAEVYGFKPRSINPSFSMLVKAGILSSQVGGKPDQRGYIFAKDPKDITIYDIVKAIEGDEPVPCCSSILKCQPAKCSDCSIHNDLQKIVDMRKISLSANSLYHEYTQMTTI